MRISLQTLLKVSFSNSRPPQVVANCCFSLAIGHVSVLKAEVSASKHWLIFVSSSIPNCFLVETAVNQTKRLTPQYPSVTGKTISFLPFEYLHSLQLEEKIRLLNNRAVLCKLRANANMPDRREITLTNSVSNWSRSRMPSCSVCVNERLACRMRIKGIAA